MKGHGPRRFATVLFTRGALVAVLVMLLGGVLGALYSIPALAPFFQSVGLDMRQLRPVHTTFAAAWIFLAGAAAVYRYLEDVGGGATDGDRWRMRVQVLAWTVAGAGILLSLLFRVTSGREYVGFHPAFSTLILVGWICYAWNFFRVTRKGFWSQPVYVTMWGVAFLFFLWTFAEQHAYLLPGIFADPIHDLRIQWKATGTLVGSFNLFVYGTAIYITEKATGDDSYGHSRTAHALLGVGLLNSFTNFGHHTYHLPQSALVNWISFVVSMTEIVVLAKAVSDIRAMLARHPEKTGCGMKASFTAAKWWTFGILFTSIIISIPPINAVVHGTYVITGHAMGAMIGIDTMLLLGALFWILSEYMDQVDGGEAGERLRTRGARRQVIAFNVAALVLVIWLHVSGITTALTRIRLAPGEAYIPPGWLAQWNGIAFTVTGVIAAGTLLDLVSRLGPAAFRPFPGRRR